MKYQKALGDPATKSGRQLVQNRIGSREKAEKELGFRYKYSLEDGLKKLIAWREEKGIRG